MSENEIENITAESASEEDIYEVKRIRIEKLNALREAGKDPYTVTKYDRNALTATIRDEFDRLENTEVRIDRKSVV